MRVWNRIRLYFQRQRLQHELSDEMQAHREMLEERFRLEGMTSEEARHAAAREFGSELSNIEQSRDEWGYRWFDSFARDVRFAVRMIVKQRGLTVAAVLTLALGVGANTAVVSVLRTMLLNPLGLRDSERVLVATVRLDKLHMKDAETSAAEYRDLRAMPDVFSVVAGMEGRAWTANAGGEPVRLRGRAVTFDFFHIFGESPALGRFFVPEDHTSAVLSYDMWQSQYGGDPLVIGRMLDLDGTLYRIVGVAPAAFRYPASAQVWTSLVLSPERMQRRGYSMMITLLARLKEGVTAEQASDRVNRFVKSITARGAEAQDHADLGYFIDLKPFAHHIAGDLRQPLWILWTAALVVLLTGCANIANLLLSRAAGRKREMAIRLSIGATRLQILRQLLIESILLGVLGGIVGLIVAAAGISFLRNVTLPGRDMLVLVSLDRPLIVYGLALSILSGLVFGIAPAIQLLRDSQAAAMARATRHRYQGVFVAAEVAASLVLVIGMGLLLSTLWRLGNIDPGFNTKDITTAFLLKPWNGAAGPFVAASTSRDPTFVERLDSRLRSLPGIESAAMAYPLPFSGGGLTSSFDIKGRERQPHEPERHGEAYLVSPTYFETLKVPLLRGRLFSDFDNLKAPLVCVIDSNLANRFFPEQDPIGQEIAMYRGSARVVGVVKAIRATAVDEESRPMVYYPLVQVPLFQQAGILVRSHAPAANLIRDAVRQTNGSVAIFDTRSLESRIGDTLGVRRLMAMLVSAFASICLFLAMVGLNGVVSQLVGERTSEISIRIVMGARTVQILRQFLGYGMAWGVAGIIVGLAAAAYTQKWLKELLFGIQPLDPITFTSAALVVLAIAGAAILWPAWRASRIAPQTVLRHE